MIEVGWEHGNKHIKSFGWVAKMESRVVGIADCEVSPTVILSSIPPWIFPMPKVDYQIQIKNEKDTTKNIIAQQFFRWLKQPNMNGKVS